jgi:hypothetical protein
MHFRSILPLFALATVTGVPACAQQGTAARQTDSTRASALSGSSPLASTARGDAAAATSATGGRVVEPRGESPHYDFIRRTFTDFC